MPETIHFMQYGLTPCFMESPPASWPVHHFWSAEWENVTCEVCLAGRNIAQTFLLTNSEHGLAFTCLRCLRTSHSPKDVEHHYCGHCHAFHDDIWPPARRWWVTHPDPQTVERQKRK